MPRRQLKDYVCPDCDTSGHLEDEYTEADEERKATSAEGGQKADPLLRTRVADLAAEVVRRRSCVSPRHEPPRGYAEERRPRLRRPARAPRAETPPAATAKGARKAPGALVIAPPKQVETPPPPLFDPPRPPGDLT